MSRKHFTALAWELRQASPRILREQGRLMLDPASDLYWAHENAWSIAVRAAADACAASNASFDRGRFYRACGLEVRPDGSMFPMAAPR